MRRIARAGGPGARVAGIHDERQLEPELREHARRRLHADATAELLHDGARDRQAQAGAAARARVARVELREAPEKLLQLVGRDAGTLVLDGEADRALHG